MVVKLVIPAKPALVKVGSWEHKNNMIEGFTKRYGVHNLVYWFSVNWTNPLRS